MGGIGSGRHYRWDTKDTTEDYRSIDIRRWYRDKLLIPNQTFITSWSRDGEIISSIEVHTQQQHITLSYRRRNSNNDWVKLSYPVLIDWTPCNYGNKRPWFLCPGKNCGRRVAILYSGKIFACRHCYQLAYPCQRETFPYRVIRKADKIRAKFSCEPGLFITSHLRPKGMHWKTFKQHSFHHNFLVTQTMSWFED